MKRRKERRWQLQLFKLLELTHNKKFSLKMTLNRWKKEVAALVKKMILQQLSNNIHKKMRMRKKNLYLRQKMKFNILLLLIKLKMLC